MFNLPKSTEVSITIPKKAILGSDSGLKKEKDAFNREVKSLKVIHEISESSLSISPSEKIDGIFFILVELKEEELSKEAITLLSSSIPHSKIFVLSYEGKYKLIVNDIKTYSTDWLSDDYSIKLEGLTVDEVYKSLVETIGGFKVREGESLKHHLMAERQIESYEAIIKKLESQKLKTKTPSKKHDIHLKIVKLQNDIEKIKKREVNFSN